MQVLLSDKEVSVRVVFRFVLVPEGVLVSAGDEGEGRRGGEEEGGGQRVRREEEKGGRDGGREGGQVGCARQCRSSWLPMGL
jgi:hypothetical protein